MIIERQANFRFKKKDILLFVLSIIIVLQSILIICLWPKKIKPVKFVPVKDRIAIVIDDWGYNRRNLNFLEEINVPLTISILPHLNYSKEIATVATDNNKEVIIHLPLEPHADRKVGLEKNVILTDMTEEKIRDIFMKASQSVPYSKGVSNHMGSKATENRRVMSILFELFKQNSLYFLDSLVTADTICAELAKEINVKFAKRDIFLDNESDEAYIKNQLSLLVDKAKQKGEAIGVGHDRILTLKIIKDSIADIEEEGIEFVFLSELVN